MSRSMGPWVIGQYHFAGRGGQDMPSVNDLQNPENP